MKVYIVRHTSVDVPFGTCYGQTDVPLKSSFEEEARAVKSEIDGVRFRQKVVPGDTLLFRVELMAPIRRGISTMKGYVFVGEKVVCEAEFTAQITKNK